MVSVNYDNYLTPTDYVPNDVIDSSYSFTITNNCGNNGRYEHDYVGEELEWMKIGWCNPRKTPIIKQPIIKKARIQIRNRL